MNDHHREAYLVFFNTEEIYKEALRKAAVHKDSRDELADALCRMAVENGLAGFLITQVKWDSLAADFLEETEEM